MINTGYGDGYKVHGMRCKVLDVRENRVFGTRLVPTVLVLIATALLLGLFQGCAEKKAVIVVKGSPEEKGGVQGECILGEYCGSITDALCSEDLENIMDRAALDTFQKEEFRSLICSGEFDARAVEEYCSSLSPDTRLRLYRAFEQYGYYINGYG